MAVVCATLQRLERASRLASRPPRRYTRGKAWRLPMWEIHLGADDRVIHAVFRAEIADVAITGIDADPHLKGLLETAGAPFLLQFGHLPLHRDSHPHAGPRILFGAFGFGIAEKHQHRVTDEFVDVRAICQRDLR